MTQPTRGETMTHDGTTGTILDNYLQARGQRADETWAGIALVTLAVRATPDQVSDSILREALATVVESEEGPEALYGEPRAWALDRLAEEAAEGRPVLPPEPDWTRRHVPVVGLVMAAMFSALFMVVLLFGGLQTEYTPGLLLFPLLAGLTGMATVTAFERTLMHRPRATALLAGGAVAAVGVAVSVALLVTTHGQVIGTASVLWMGALALGYAALAALVGALLPEARATGRASDAQSDVDWEHRVAGLLRLHGGMTESRVRDVLREAQQHAARSGRSLVEEFGPAASYASRFPRDHRAELRRRAWMWTLLVPVAATVAFAGLLDTTGWEGISWWGVLMVAISVISAWHAWSRVRRPAPAA